MREKERETTRVSEREREGGIKLVAIQIILISSSSVVSPVAQVCMSV